MTYVTRAAIISDDHGLWVVVSLASYGDSGFQGFGGYALYLPKHSARHKLNSLAGHFIWRCMEIAEVTEWSQLQGKTIRVRIEDGLIVAIGHIVKNDWFCPKQDFEQGVLP